MYGGADGTDAKMNLRKQPVNRNASHGSPSKEDSKGNSKKRPQWLEQEAPHRHQGHFGARRVLGDGSTTEITSEHQVMEELI